MSLQHKDQMSMEFLPQEQIVPQKKKPPTYDRGNGHNKTVKL